MQTGKLAFVYVRNGVVNLRALQGRSDECNYLVKGGRQPVRYLIRFKCFNSALV